MRYGQTALSLMIFLVLSGWVGAQDKTLTYVSSLLSEARNEFQYHRLARVHALLAGANALIDEALIGTCAPLADAKPLFEQAMSAQRDSEFWEAMDEIEGIVTTCEDLAFASAASSLGQIAFVSDQDLDGNNELYVMTADGAIQRPLTAPDYGTISSQPLSFLEPAWSPDGTQIAFTSWEDLYLLDISTQEIRQIMENATSPAWSPDGTQIAFSSKRDGGLDIFVMSPDGSNLERLTNDPVGDYNPAWSPDGTQIAFMSHRDGGGLYIMSAHGTDLTLLTPVDMFENVVDWSPDGTRIVFSGSYNGDLQIAVINSDGTDLRVLTDKPAENKEPSWSPDGSQIVFTSDLDGDAEIHVMDADGGNVQLLTNNEYNDQFPVWFKVSYQPQ